MPANLAFFCGLIGRGWKLVASHRMQHRCAAVGNGDGDATAGKCPDRFHNWLDRHHFKRIERCQRCSGNREQHTAERDRSFVEQHQRRYVRDSEHHARDLGLPAEYRLPLGCDQLSPCPGRPGPGHLQRDPRHLEHGSPQRDARKSAGLGKRDSVEGRQSNRQCRGAIFGSLFTAASRERSSSLDPGCDR